MQEMQAKYSNIEKYSYEEIHELLNKLVDNYLGLPPNIDKMDNLAKVILLLSPNNEQGLEEIQYILKTIYEEKDYFGKIQDGLIDKLAAFQPKYINGCAANAGLLVQLKERFLQSIKKDKIITLQIRHKEATFEAIVRAYLKSNPIEFSDYIYDVVSPQPNAFLALANIMEFNKNKVLIFKNIEFDAFSQYHWKYLGEVLKLVKQLTFEGCAFEKLNQEGFQQLNSILVGSNIDTLIVKRCFRQEINEKNFKCFMKSLSNSPIKNLTFCYNFLNKLDAAKLQEAFSYLQDTSIIELDMRDNCGLENWTTEQTSLFFKAIRNSKIETLILSEKYMERYKKDHNEEYKELLNSPQGVQRIANSPVNFFEERGAQIVNIDQKNTSKVLVVFK